MCNTCKRRHIFYTIRNHRSAPKCLEKNTRDARMTQILSESTIFLFQFSNLNVIVKLLAQDIRGFINRGNARVAFLH